MIKAGQHHQQRGLTLIEAVAALVVLAVAAPASLWAIRDATVLRSSSVMATKARCLAVEKIEDVIADRNSTTRGWGFVVNGNYTAENPVSGYAGFGRSVTVSETGASLNGGGTGYKTVTVTVTWIDPRSGAQSLSLTTVLTDY